MRLVDAEAVEDVEDDELLVLGLTIRDELPSVDVQAVNTLRPAATTRVGKRSSSNPFPSSKKPTLCSEP